VWFDDMGYEATLASAEASRRALRTDALDVLLIHFPGSIDAVQSPAANRRARAETWRALERLHADGRAKRIGARAARLARSLRRARARPRPRRPAARAPLAGVSNWTRRHLRELLGAGGVRPHVLQTEVHPRLQQAELLADARAAGIPTLMGYCPLAAGAPALLAHTTLADLAARRGCTPAQLALRWAVDSGVTPIPKASSDARLRENLAALALPPLDAAERAAIDGLEAGDRCSFDPALIA
jgi:2,5-diketo-D-gluconate reductase A